MSLVPTMNLRFEERMVPVPDQRIGGGVFVQPKFVLQQMFLQGDKQIWKDIPTVRTEAKKDGQ